MKDEILELLDRDPFVPFAIVLTSGDRYEVTNPHLVAMGESVIYVVRARSNRYDILRLNQIAATEVLEPAP